MKKWYVLRVNTTSYSIEYLSDEGLYYDGATDSFGPFKTFTDAKKEAIEMLRGDMSELRTSLRDIQASRKSDFK